MSRVVMPATAFEHDRPRKGGRMKDDRHLAFIRKLPSVLSGEYGCETCHIRMGDPRHGKPSTAGGRKADDAWTVPMTPEEHWLQHSMGEYEFWQMQGVDPGALALALYQNTGDVEAAERLIRAHLRSIGR